MKKQNEKTKQKNLESKIKDHWNILVIKIIKKKLKWGILSDLGH